MVQITTTSKPVLREAKTIRITAKCSDLCTAVLADAAGVTIAVQEDGYVPGFMPGNDGDYVDIDIDIDTGQILNWRKPTQRDIEAWLTNESVQVLT